MKAAIAEYPVLPNVEIRPFTQTAKQARPVSRAQVTAHVTKLLVVLASVGMMYGLINYGRIFENYLQW
jgi:hypothetical protein